MNICRIRVQAVARVCTWAAVLHSWQIVDSVEVSSELTSQCLQVCVCVCGCASAPVKTNEFSLQGLRCSDSAHRIAAPEFSLSRS